MKLGFRSALQHRGIAVTSTSSESDFAAHFQWLPRVCGYSKPDNKTTYTKIRISSPVWLQNTVSFNFCAGLGIFGHSCAPLQNLQPGVISQCFSEVSLFEHVSA